MKLSFKIMLMALINLSVSNVFANNENKLDQLSCQYDVPYMRNTCYISEFKEPAMFTLNDPSGIHESSTIALINSGDINLIPMPSNHNVALELRLAQIIAKNKNENQFFVPYVEGKIFRLQVDKKNKIYGVEINKIISSQEVTNEFAKWVKNNSASKQTNNKNTISNSCPVKEFIDGFLTAVSARSGTAAGAISVGERSCTKFQVISSGTATQSTAVGSVKIGWALGHCCK